MKCVSGASRKPSSMGSICRRGAWLAAAPSRSGPPRSRPSPRSSRRSGSAPRVSSRRTAWPSIRWRCRSRLSGAACESTPSTAPGWLPPGAPCRAAAADAARWVACGGPFPGHRLRVADARGRPVGERIVGEILVSGPSVMRGYLGGSEATGQVIRDGWLATGDLGYVADGELYVCGRRKETIIVGGRNYFPHDLGSAVDGAPGVRSGSVAAFAATAPGRPDRAVMIVETHGAVSDDALQAEVRRRVLQATGLALDEIVLVPKGTIARTSSGKLRRAVLRERYAAGTLIHQNGRVNGRPATS